MTDALNTAREAEWHRDGNFLYTLQHAGWSRAGEKSKNHLTVRVEVHQGDAADAEALADRLHKFLSAAQAPTAAPGASWTEGQVEAVARAICTKNGDDPDAPARYSDDPAVTLMWHYSRPHAEAALATLNAAPPAGVVEALRFYADPSTYESESQINRDEMFDTPIQGDDYGERARQALATLSRGEGADARCVMCGRVGVIPCARCPDAAHHPETGAPSREALIAAMKSAFTPDGCAGPNIGSMDYERAASTILVLYPTPPALKASDLEREGVDLVDRLRSIADECDLVGDDCCVAVDDLRSVLALLSSRPAAPEDHTPRAVPLSTISEGWRPTTEEPDVGRKFICLYNDGSGAVMLFRHDGGMIDSDGDEWPFSLKDFDRWAYLPDELEFACENYAEDPITLHVLSAPPAPSLSTEGEES